MNKKRIRWRLNRIAKLREEISVLETDIVMELGFPIEVDKIELMLREFDLPENVVIELRDLRMKIRDTTRSRKNV